MLETGPQKDECICKRCRCKHSEALRWQQSSKLSEGLEENPTSKNITWVGKKKIFACTLYDKGFIEEEDHPLFRKLSKASIVKCLNEIKRKHNKISKHSRKEIWDTLCEMTLQNGNALLLEVINTGNLPKVIRIVYTNDPHKEYPQEQKTIGKRKHIFWLKRLKEEFRVDKEKATDLKGAHSCTPHSSSTYFIYRPHSPTIKDKQTSTRSIPIDPKKGSVIVLARNKHKGTSLRGTPDPQKTNDKSNFSKHFIEEREKYVLVHGQDRIVQTSFRNISYQTSSTNVQLSSKPVQIKAEEGHSSNSQGVTKQSSEDSITFQFFKKETEERNLMASIQATSKRIRGRSLSYPPSSKKVRKQRIDHPLTHSKIVSSHKVISTEAKEEHVAAFTRNQHMSNIRQREYSSITRNQQSFEDHVSQDLKTETITSHTRDQLNQINCQSVNYPLEINELRSSSISKTEREEENLAAAALNPIKLVKDQILLYPPTSNKIREGKITTHNRTANGVISTQAEGVFLEICAHVKIKPKFMEMEHDKESENPSNLDLTKKTVEQTKEGYVARNDQNVTNKTSKGITHYVYKTTDAQTSTEFIPTQHRTVKSGTGPRNTTMPEDEGGSLSNSATSDMLRASELIRIKLEQGNEYTITRVPTQVIMMKRSFSSEKTFNNKQISSDFVQIHNVEEDNVITSQDLTSQNSGQEMSNLEKAWNTENPNVFFFTEHKDITFSEDTQEHSTQISVENSSNTSEDNHVIFSTELMVNEGHQANAQDQLLLSSNQTNVYPINTSKLKISAEFILTDHEDVWIIITSKTNSADKISVNCTERRYGTITQDLTKKTDKDNIAYPAITKHMRPTPLGNETNSQVTKEIQTSTEFNPGKAKEATLAGAHDQANQTSKGVYYLPPTRAIILSLPFIQEKQKNDATITKNPIKQIIGSRIQATQKNEETQISIEFILAECKEEKLTSAHDQANQTSERMSNLPQTITITFASAFVQEKQEEEKGVTKIKNQIKKTSGSRIHATPINEETQTSAKFILAECEEGKLTSAHDQANQTSEGIPNLPQTSTITFSPAFIEEKQEQGSGVAIMKNQIKETSGSRIPSINEETQTPEEFTAIDNIEITRSASAQNQSIVEGTPYLPSASQLIRIKLELEKYIAKIKELKNENSKESNSCQTASNDKEPSAEHIKNNRQVNTVLHSTKCSSLQTSTEVIVADCKEVTLERNLEQTKQTGKEISYLHPTTGITQFSDDKREKGYNLTSRKDLSKQSTLQNVSRSIISTETQISTGFIRNSNRHMKLVESNQDLNKRTDEKRIFYSKINTGQLLCTELIQANIEEENCITTIRDETNRNSEERLYLQTSHSKLPSHELIQTMNGSVQMNRVKGQEIKSENVNKQTNKGSIKQKSITKEAQTPTEFTIIDRKPEKLSANAQKHVKRANMEKIMYESPINNKLVSSQRIIPTKFDEGHDMTSTLNETNRTIERNITNVPSVKEPFSKPAASAQFLNKEDKGKISDTSTNCKLSSTTFIQTKLERHYVRTDVETNKQTSEINQTYKATICDKLLPTDLIQAKLKEGQNLTCTEAMIKQTNKVSYPPPTGCKLPSTELIQVEIGQEDHINTSQDLTKRTSEETISYLSLPQTEHIRVKSDERNVTRSSSDLTKESSSEKISHEYISSGKQPHKEIFDVKNRGKEVATSTIDFMKETREEKIFHHVASGGKLPSMETVKDREVQVATSILDFNKEIRKETLSHNFSSSGLLHSTELIQVKNKERYETPLTLDRADSSTVGSSRDEVPGPSLYQRKSTQITKTQKRFNPPPVTSTKPQCQFAEQLLKNMNKKSGRFKARTARISYENQLRARENMFPKAGNKHINRKKDLKRTNETKEKSNESSKKVYHRKK